MKKPMLTKLNVTPFINQLLYVVSTGKKGRVSTAIIFVCLLFATPFNSFAQKPVLIEFGWYYRDVAQLSQQLDSMQHTPFDGISFSLQRTIMEAFDTIEKKDAYFECKKLKSLKWGKYKNNFIILRGFSKTGGNWFSDSGWRTISKNMNGLSKAMLTGKVEGILFDPEYYYEDKLYNPWTYNKSQYPSLSFEEVQNKVRARGTQFIAALQKHKTDLTFLSIWLASLIAEERKYTPLEGTRHALLLPFIEGILLGKNKKVKVVDGNEYAYWNYKPSQFLESAGFLRKNMVDLMKTKKAKAAVADIGIAQCVFYDGLLGRAPSFEKGLANNVKWKWLEDNLKYAFAASDHIVWFYAERLNWWDGSANDTLLNMLNAARQVYSVKKPALTKAKSTITDMRFASGSFYANNTKTPMQEGGKALTIKWVPKKRNLDMQFYDKKPLQVAVFVNNRLVKNIEPLGMKQSIVLKEMNIVNITVVTKYEEKLEASATLFLP